MINSKQGSVSESGFSENSEFVNPEMRGNSGLSASEREVSQTRDRGSTPFCFQKISNLNSESVIMAT